MIRFTEGDSVSYTSFLYDDQNRLVTIMDSNNNGYKTRFDMFYDNQGRMWKVSEDGAGFYTFDFDNKGFIIRKSFFHPGQQTSAIVNSYNYDANGRVITDSVYNYWTAAAYEIVTYYYDQQNNVTESKLIEKGSGTILVQQQCSYDNHPNPLNGKSVLNYFLDSGYDVPNGKNNLLKILYDDGTIVSYSYEYDNNGFPKKRIESINNDPLITYTDYYYE